MQQAIAILDSGVGGLTVAKEVMRQLPQEKVIYFGDSERSPYGPRNAEEVIRFTHQIVSYLLQFQPKMIVIACNTATAVAIDQIRARLSIPVVGVIHPGARAAIKKTQKGKVGVIGTDGTIMSRAYELALREISPELEVVSQACPSFVPLVERGLYDTVDAQREVALALRTLRDKPIDCLILGCTHYPFLQQAISHVMGTEVALINSADETAREVSTVLYHRGQLAQSLDKPVHQFLCSGNPQMFQHIAQRWLDEQVQVKSVTWPMTRII